MSKPVKGGAKGGASQSKTRLADRLKAWLGHHRQVAADSLLRLLRSPLQSLLTWLVVAIAIALPGAMYLALSEFQNLGERWQAEPQISVFLNHRAREEAVLQLRDSWQAKPEIAAVDYVSPQGALDEFKVYSGLGNVLETLEENPLPAVLVVRPEPAHANPAQLEVLGAELGESRLVDEVQLDMAWVRRLDRLMTIGQRAVAALGGLLCLGVLLVIGNTIRLHIENRRDEILVVKLVGGTDGFVRRPFLYTGFWYGLGGGVIAWVLLQLGVAWLSGPVAELAALYDSRMTLTGLNAAESLLILLGTGLLGLAGAALAVSRHLHTIEPT